MSGVHGVSMELVKSINWGSLIRLVCDADRTTSMIYAADMRAYYTISEFLAMHTHGLPSVEEEEQ
jgi:hypothetical protein